MKKLIVITGIIFFLLVAILIWASLHFCVFSCYDEAIQTNNRSLIYFSPSTKHLYLNTVNDLDNLRFTGLPRFIDLSAVNNGRKSIKQVPPDSVVATIEEVRENCQQCEKEGYTSPGMFIINLRGDWIRISWSTGGNARGRDYTYEYRVDKESRVPTYSKSYYENWRNQ